MPYRVTILVALLFGGPLAAIWGSAAVAPAPQPVEGGRVTWIETMAVSAAGAIAGGYQAYYTLVSTDGPNAMFYATADPLAAPSEPGPFAPVPDLASGSGFGDLGPFAVDHATGQFFFSDGTGVWRGSVAPDTLARVSAVAAGRHLAVHAGRLFFTAGTALHFGAIDPASGAFQEHPDSPVTLPLASGNPMLLASPHDGHLILFQPGTALLRSTAPAALIDETTAYYALQLPASKSGAIWTAVGRPMGGCSSAESRRTASGR